MSNRQAVALIGIGVILLLAAVSIPAVIESSQSTQSSRLTIDTAGTDEVTAGLDVAIADSSNTDANITLTDTESGVDDNVTLSVGDSANYTLPGGNGTITLVSSTNQQATIDVFYSSTYGFGSAGKTIVNELGLILVAMVFIIVMGSVVVVVN